MDVISLHMSGIENGGKFRNFPDHRADQTDQKAYGKRNDPFDGDNAGIKASFRSIDMLLTEGMNIRVLAFPGW
jgi:DNA primase